MKNSKKWCKYNVKESFFEKIDSPEKAYFLGFLYADGTIRHKLINGPKKNDGTRSKKFNHIIMLSLQERDKEILVKLRDLIFEEKTRPLYFIKKSKTDLNRQNQYRLDICNKKVCLDVIALGCTPNKSKTLRFPQNNQVPNRYVSHFIRGYFDGDGGFYNNGRVFNISIISNVRFLKEIKEALNKQNIKSSIFNHYSCDHMKYLNIVDVQSLYNFFQYIYTEKGDLYLARKYQKMKNFIISRINDITNRKWKKMNIKIDDLQ